MQAPRGTRDFTPGQMRVRRQVEARLRRAFEAYGFGEVQTPTFENLELFTAKSGPAIEAELYSFKDKSERELALRPELTAAVLRFYFTSMKMEPKPVRLYYVANCFRYDRPQAGRYREFWQMGCEVIGDNGPASLAQLVRLAAELVDAAGLSEYVLRIGHLDLLRGVLEDAGVEAQGQGELMRLIDKRDDDAIRDRLGDAADQVLSFLDTTDADGLARYATTDATRAALAELVDVRDRVVALGADAAKVRLDPGIARGLDYYSGLVFELDAPRLGAEKQLLGGGVYDLAEVFEAAAVDQVGFALGFDRLLVALEAEDGLPEPEATVDVFAAALDESALTAVAQAAQALRSAGARVELSTQPRAPKKAFSRADQAGARYALIMGPRELEAGSVAWKDLSTGDQTIVPHSGLAKHWQALA